MKLIYTDIHELDDLAGLELLAPSRREKTLRFLKHADQARSLAAGLLLRRFIGSEEGLVYLPHGKPCWPGGPSFNLSHSGSYVLLGISDHQIGVDIEAMVPWSEKVAHRCFVPSELHWLYGQTESLRAFYTLWTAKECIMKASGAGFTMPPETFRIDPEKTYSFDASGTLWHLHWADLPGHRICAATSAPEEHIVLQQARRSFLLG